MKSTDKFYLLFLSCRMQSAEDLGCWLCTSFHKLIDEGYRHLNKNWGWVERHVRGERSTVLWISDPLTRKCPYDGTIKICVNRLWANAACFQVHSFCIWDGLEMLQSSFTIHRQVQFTTSQAANSILLLLYSILFALVHTGAIGRVKSAAFAGKEIALISATPHLLCCVDFKK